MDERFAAGDAVQTPLGKGVVRDVQNNGRLVIQVQQRTVVMSASTVSRLKRLKHPTVPSAAAVLSPALRRHAPSEVDLHGLRVEEALSRIDDALDAALLAGLSEVRFVHGRSGDGYVGRFTNGCAPFRRCGASASIRTIQASQSSRSDLICIGLNRPNH